MCCLAVDLLFAAKSLHRLKCTYFIKHPEKGPASYLAAVCLQGGRIQLRTENRSVLIRRRGAVACMQQETPGVQLVDQKTSFITVMVMVLNFHNMSLIIVSNQVPEKQTNARLLH